MPPVQFYQELIVWQKAVDMAASIYVIVKSFPKDERFALTSQVTRAAVSVATNIAEGNGRSGPKEYAHFLSIARGSLLETETLLVISVKLGYQSREQIEPTIGAIREIDRMLCAMRRRLTGRAADP